MYQGHFDAWHSSTIGKKLMSSVTQPQFSKIPHAEKKWQAQLTSTSTAFQKKKKSSVFLIDHDINYWFFINRFYNTEGPLPIPKFIKFSLFLNQVVSPKSWQREVESCKQSTPYMEYSKSIIFLKILFYQNIVVAVLYNDPFPYQLKRMCCFNLFY